MLCRFAAAMIGLIVAVGLPGVARSQQSAERPSPSSNEIPAASESEETAALTLEELEVLAAPIALYPDDLVALCISASIYPLQVVQAARFLDDKQKDKDLEPNEKWDGSIVSLLNYPKVLEMMSDDLDWTQQLGEAAVNQQKDLLVAIQQLRDEAVAKDILKSTDKVKVKNEGENVTIASADPKTIYVPTYPPEMLYEPGYVIPSQPIVYDSYPSYYYPTAPYWAALTTGVAFAAVVDWDNWGTWGGDLDIDVNLGDRADIDFNKIDLDKIDVNRLKNLDLRNIDRSKLNLTNANIDRSKLKQNLQSKDFNNIARRGRENLAARGPIDRQVRAGDLKGKDIRKNAAEGLKQRPGAQLPAPGAKLPDAKRVSDQSKSARASQRPAAGAGQRPAAKAGQRPAAKAGQKPAAKQAAQKKASGPKAATRIDNRPSKPSAIGNPRPGRATANYSSRGAVSRGGGSRGGSISRSGGRGGGGMPRGGGGRGGGGRGGGRR